MHLFGKDLDKDVVIIAEIGVNHEGDADIARKMVRMAHEAGADAVKFQTYTPERFVGTGDPARLERVRGFALSDDELRDLAREADQLGIAMFSAAISEDKIPLLAELFPVIKIASGDLDFEPVIRAAAATGKPVIISTGLGTVEEVDQAIAWFKGEVGQDDVRDRLHLMHCVTAYPTPIEDANVLAVPYLAARTGLTVGYSNHVIGPEACFAAVAHGASSIEVHFTDCKTGRDFRDHELSCDPDDLKTLVEMIPRVRQSLGTPGKVRQEAEKPLLDAVRKGVVAARDLNVGDVLSREDLMFARPATEFPSGEVDTLVGKKVTAPYRLGESIRRADVDMG
ncbi:N-acetylneuraminate synthase family protein [Pseudomonadota bacterium]